MRNILGVLAVLALVTVGASKAAAQALTPFALTVPILVKSETTGNGVAIETLEIAHEGLQLSSAFDDACASSPDLESVCDAVDGIQPGTPAALAIATLVKAGWEFRDSWPVRYVGPSANADDNAARRVDVIFTAVTPDDTAPSIEVRQIGCDFSSGGGMTTFIQEADDDGALAVTRVIRDEGERCVDSIQDAIDQNLSLREAVKTAREDPLIGFNFALDLQGTVAGAAPAPAMRYVELYTLTPE